MNFLARSQDSILRKPKVWAGEGNGTPLQYSCLENPMDGGAWWAAVHGVAMSWTRLSDFTFTFHFHALEKEMATHSRILAWRIPGTGEPGGLLSMGLHRVGHDWSDLAARSKQQQDLSIFIFRLKILININSNISNLIDILNYKILLMLWGWSQRVIHFTYAETTASVWNIYPQSVWFKRNEKQSQQNWTSLCQVQR